MRSNTVHPSFELNKHQFTKRPFQKKGVVEKSLSHMNNLAPDLVIKERKCQLGALFTASSNILCQTLVKPCSGWNGWPISLLFVRFLPLTINSASLLGCVYTWFPGTDARVQYLWALMWTHLFWRTRARIRARFTVPEYKVLTLYSGTKVGTGSLWARVFRWFQGLLLTVNFFSPFAKMASADGANWTKDNLGTESVDKAPLILYRARELVPWH